MYFVKELTGVLDTVCDLREKGILHAVNLPCYIQKANGEQVPLMDMEIFVNGMNSKLIFHEKV